MGDRGTTAGRAGRPRRGVGLVVGGVLSLATFFVPLVAPFVQLVTLASVAAALRRRDVAAPGLAIGAGGALLGLVLHLLVQYVWIV